MMEIADQQVAVVVLNWNGARLTLGCIEALEKSDYKSLEIIVIDNGSTDGSQELIAARRPGVTLLRNSENLGFAAASNQGIRHAVQNGAAYVLLLNNDTVVDPKMISHLVETAVRHQNRVAVSPKMYDGFHPERIWFVYGKTNLWTGVFSNPAYCSPATSIFESEIEMEYASGCCILVPREVIRSVGEFDAGFFAYCEDVEWSIRARRAGFGLLCDTRATLLHYIASTGGKNPARMRCHMTRNHLWTMRKHATALQLAVFSLLFYPPRCLLRLAKAVKRGQWACIPAEFHGALDGFFAPLALPNHANALRETQEQDS